MFFRCTIPAALLLSLTACVSPPQAVRDNPNTPKVVVTTTMTADDAYRTVNANLVRCFAGANYLIAGAPSSPSRPPQVLVNSTLGHSFAVIDFAPKGGETEVTVNVAMAVARARRADGWKQAMVAWLKGGDQDFCQAGP